MDNWDEYYEILKNIYLKKGKIVAKKNELVKGLDIYRWLEKQRINYRKKRLTKEQIKKLEIIGMNWWRYCSWLDIYQIYFDYYSENNNIDIPNNYIIDETYLREWLLKQKYLYLRNSLSLNKIKMLDDIGVEWDLKNDFTENYLIAKKYYEKYGHLSIYEDEVFNGVKLKNWLDTYRILYKNNILSKDKIVLLESIGIEWDLSDKNWNIMYKAAYKYFQKHNNINIYIGERINGISLGAWIENQMTLYNNRQLSKEKIQKLELLNIKWIKKNSWDEMYSFANHFYSLHKHLNVPNNYKIAGVNLGKWIILQRYSYKYGILDVYKIKQLDKIGMIWVRETVNSSWELLYLVALNYYNQFHDLEFEDNYMVHGVNLKNWLNEQYRNYQLDKLTPSKCSKLEKIGFVKIKPQTIDNEWMEYYECAKKYYYENKNLLVPRNCIISNIKLGSWIYKMRTMYRDNKLIPIKIHKLEKINMIWNVPTHNKIEKQKNTEVEFGNLQLFFQVFSAKYGDYLLDGFLHLISENMSEEKIVELKNIIKGMFNEDCYNIFILLLADYDKKTISSAYCMSLKEIEKLRLSIYEVILKQLHEPIFDKEKKFIRSTK